MEAENEAENSGKRLTERHSAYDPFSSPEFTLRLRLTKFQQQLGVTRSCVWPRTHSAF
jgi:hypothetical protein